MYRCFRKCYLNIIILLILICGLWQFGSGTYIFVKATLAQFLLENAWSKNVNDGIRAKPWKWADTYPVAKIIFDSQQKEFIVLAGASGRNMAFGPTHVSATPLPGQQGNSVIVGHRDTHFAALQYLTLGEIIRIQLSEKNLRYQIVDTFVINENQIDIMTSYDQEILTLVTCYPFKAIQPGGPLRYVVQAVLIESL